MCCSPCSTTPSTTGCPPLRRLPRGRRGIRTVRGEAHGLARGTAGMALARRCASPFWPARPRCHLDQDRAAVPGRGAHGGTARADPHGGGESRALRRAGTSWLLLDAELLPWNVKAGSLLRDQYAVGAAALASLPAAVSVLEQACARGLPEGHPLRGHCLRGHCPGSAPCWSGPRPGWPTRRRSPPPTCATAGPPTGWPGCGSPRSSCSPPKAPSTTSGRTCGTSA